MRSIGFPCGQHPDEDVALIATSDGLGTARPNPPLWRNGGRSGGVRRPLETQGYALPPSLADTRNLHPTMTSNEQVDERAIANTSGSLSAERFANVAEMADFVADVK
ncbi:hypothetical protein GCM10017607_17460 [Microbacterium thalassium]|nr:hypothetical protein GCM10017607_17460 [Microbacterium thalassium]